MSDPRSTPANGRVAHARLRGRHPAPRFSTGNWRRVIAPTAPLLASPGGARNRELLLGQRFLVLDDHAGFSFGEAERDGYVGYLPSAALGPDTAPSHRIGAIRSYAKQVPALKDTGPQLLLSFGAELHVTGQTDAWAHTTINGAEMFVPMAHLVPLAPPASDPIKVARMFLGTPYLWGGNSALGIDCSGLVQAALLACAIPCPGDSDQQQASLGTPLPEGTPLQAGDLLFWAGHVALCTDAHHIIHANATHMAVVEENAAAAIARIQAAGDGPVTAHKRL